MCYEIMACMANQDDILEEYQKWENVMDANKWNWDPLDDGIIMTQDNSILHPNQVSPFSNMMLMMTTLVIMSSTLIHVYSVHHQLQISILVVTCFMATIYIWHGVSQQQQ